MIFLFLLIILLISQNILTAIDDFRRNMTVQVYVDRFASRDLRNNIESRLWNITGVSQVHYISPEDALEFMMEYFGDELFTALAENPLPHSFEVKVDRNHLGWENLSNIAKNAANIEGVAEVDFAADLMRRMEDFREFLILMGLVFIVLISLAATAVVANSAQLLYYQHNLKIAIMRDLGAAEFYLAKPLIYKGAMIGLISTVVSGMLTVVVFWLVNSNLIEIEFLNPAILLGLIVWAVFWGAVGGYNGYVLGKRSPERKLRKLIMGLR